LTSYIKIDKAVQKSTYILLIIILFVVSCVPLSKFNELKKRSDACTEENANYKAENEKLQVSNTEFKSQLDMLTADKDKLIRDSVSIYKQWKQLQYDNNKLQQEYQYLQQSQDNLSKGNAKESTKLLSQLQSTQEDLQRREDQLVEKKRNLDALTLELEKKNKRMREMELVLNKKDSVVNALKNSVSDALMGFENKGLSIKIVNGKVYVSLEEKLLFKSGSIVVDPDGVKALKKLAKVLEQNKDINIMIEGHTDDVPYHSDASVKDNWDLSVKRATSIVRILLDGSGIDPRRFTAAGRGEFVPVDKAKSSEARQKNRRTEIILTPKLDELFKILETN
jgi:chemotaxis protein MotB